MIRLRDRATGAVAEWNPWWVDPAEWSGDPDFATLLRLWMRTEMHVSSHTPGGDIQRRIAELAPRDGFDVVDQVAPVEQVHNEPGVVY